MREQKNKPPAPMGVGPAAHRGQRTDILPPLGRCINCRIRIDLRAGASRCPTCAAWRRWFSAHRIASQALREATHG